MKKTIITAIALILTLIINAQTTTMQQIISEDQEFRDKIEQIGYTQDHAQFDDSYMLGMLGLVFSSSGERFFQEFSSKSNRANFYLNSLNKMTDVSGYYQDNIKGYKFDSISVNIYTSELGDIHEHYFFYLNGEKIRHIQLTFLEGKQLKVWDDDTKVAERAKRLVNN